MQLLPTEYQCQTAEVKGSMILSSGVQWQMKEGSGQARMRQSNLSATVL